MAGEPAISRYGGVINMAASKAQIDAIARYDAKHTVQMEKAIRSGKTIRGTYTFWIVAVE